MRRRCSIGAVVTCAACLALAACSDDGPSGSADAATIDAGVPIDPGIVARPQPRAPPIEPAPPAAVTLAPCPDGWAERVSARDGGATVCEPFPDGDPGDCTTGGLPVPGMRDCVSLGEPLAPGTFHPTVDDTAFFVDRSAAPGGDGTRARPFTTIAAALEAAPASAVVALAAGDYDERIEILREVTIRGAGIATRIAPSDVSAAAVTVAANAGLEAVSIVSRGGAIAVTTSTTLSLLGVSIDASGAAIATPAVDVGEAARLAMESVVVRGGGIRVATGATASGLSLASLGAPSVAIDVTGGTLALARSIVRRAGAEGIRVSEGGDATITSSVVAATVRTGVLVSGDRAEVAIEDSVVRDVAGEAASAGVRADRGGTVRMARVLIERAIHSGVFASGVGTSASLERIVVRDSGVDIAEGATAFGIGAVDGAFLDAAQMSIEGSGVAGAAFFRATAQLRDVHVLDVVDPTGEVGVGLLVGSSVVTVRRADVRGAYRAGVIASDPSAQALLSDVAIRGTRPTISSYGNGTGAHAQTGAKLILERVLLEDNVGNSLFVMNQDASVTGTDVTIRATRAATTGGLAGYGFGLDVQAGSHVDLERLHIEESVGLALLVRGARARIRDLGIRGVAHWEREPLFGSMYGRAIDVQSESTLDLTRAEIEGSHDVAISVMQSSRLDARDVVVRDTRDDGVAGLEGRALVVYLGATARVDRARFEGNRYVGASSYNAGSRLELFDVEVLDTLEAVCAPMGCAAGGVGVGAYDGAEVRAERFRIASSALAGVQIARGGQLDIAHGEVSRSPIGANVQEPGYDLERITNDVRYVDNTTNLDATILPVPNTVSTVDVVADEMP